MEKFWYRSRAVLFKPGHLIEWKALKVGSTKTKVEELQAQLEPLNAAGGDSLLRNENKCLKEKNRKLQSSEDLVALKAKVEELQAQLSETKEIKRLEEENQKPKETRRNKLKSDILTMIASTIYWDSAMSVESSTSAEDLAAPKAKEEELQAQLSETKSMNLKKNRHTSDEED